MNNTDSLHGPTSRRRASSRWVTGLSAAVLLALGSVSAHADHATLEVDVDGDNCAELLAGQTINAGEVCFAVDGTDLVVTYATYNGWEINEAHLWVGNTLDGYPKTRQGNPKVGNFPYNSGDISGSTQYSMYVPLGSVTALDLADLHGSCGATDALFAMAHAALQRRDGSGEVVQTETGWSEGENVVEKGSWATRTSLTLSVVCDQGPAGPQPRAQETAMMFGGIVLNEDGDGICDGEFTAKRWGWQDGPLAEGGSYTNPIYAAAGNNVLESGTHIGNVTIHVQQGLVFTLVDLFEGFEALDTHIYVGTDPVCSASFGRDWTYSAAQSIDTSNGVYVGVHLDSEGDCQENGNYCAD